jgi:sec-independent protein translocase protein TatA
MFGSLGWQELLIVLVILALVFGASRVGALGGALGRGIREFRSEATKPDGGEAGNPDASKPAASAVSSEAPTKTG